MKKPAIVFSTLLCVAFFMNAITYAQTLKVPANSPTQTLKQNFGLGDITIEYSRPSLKGRTAFGEVVPFDKLWRTGANGCTKITFSDNVVVEGHPLTAGTYALFTIPGKTAWTIIFNKNYKQSGTSSYKQEEDALRFTVQAGKLADPVETFTIELQNMRPTSAEFELTWETTRVGFAVATVIDSAIMANIASALSPEDKRPYFQAANYYFENGKDLNQALEWVNKALEQNPKGFFIAHLKAKILAKQGKFEEAKAAAELSMSLAKDANNEDFIQLNKKLLATFVKKG